MDRVLLSTGKDDWETPADLFSALHKEFNFTIDVAASDTNHKLPRYYTQEDNGLTKSWAGERVFCNPPYSRKSKTNPGQAAWIKKAYEEAQKGAFIVLLLPARTDTKAFHRYILPHAKIKFIEGRLHFETDGKPHDAAPFPSMLCIFKPKKENTEEWMQ